MSTLAVSERIFQRVPAAAVATIVFVVAGCGDGDAERTEDDPESVEAQRFITRPDLTPPVIEVETSGETASGLLFVAPKKADAQTGPLIIDNDGDVIWSNPREGNVADFRVQEYNGESVLTWWEGTSKDGYGDGEFVIMDSSYREVTRLTPGNDRDGDLHEFQLTDAGTALILAYEAEPADLSAFGGPEDGQMLNSYVQEIDVETGDVVFEWAASEHVPMSDTYVELDEESGEEKPFDWFHVNSVTEDGDDKLLVSARNTHAVYSVDRNTGEVRWVLGGKSSDFAMDDETTFTWQHDARRLPDGTMSVFDNQAAPATGEESRAVFLDVDEDTQTVQLVDERRDPNKPLAGSQGNAQVFDDGSVLVGWGSEGYVTEFGPDNQPVMRATLTPAETYRAFRMPWTAHPAADPDLVVNARDDGELDVYMSWNGATEIDKWRVLGGDDPANLEPIAMVDKDGFETSVSVERLDRISVEALDASDAVLGRSDVFGVD